ncbi:MAG: lipoprotein-releasing ABC transporter permease subunit [Cellvibrionaceae bacterium]|nr:lipoprotein-releasing ABC transporter permease subunit [Cellvibrionaceae bacterium]
MLKKPFNFVSLYIGLRYTRSKRRNGFIAFVSMFALLGMGLGVFALVVVLSVMNGFDHELKQRILRVVPHGFLSAKTPIEDWQALAEQVAPTEGLLASAPFVEGQGLLTFDQRVRGIEIKGVLPEVEQHISEVDDFMLLGAMENLQPGEYGVVLGALLARSLGVTRGDKINITLPQISVTPAGVFPRSKRFTLVGVFEVGAQVDQYLAIIHLGDAQKLFRTGVGVQGIHLKFADIYQAPAKVQTLARGLGENYIAKDWSQTQGSLFSAVKMEKTVVSVMLGIIIAVAALNIVTSLVMMVAEKRSDIAVLRTMGLSRGNIIAVFVVQGGAMAIFGIFLGAFFGVLTANNLSQIMGFAEAAFGWQIFDPDVYFVSYLPSVWRWQDTALVCALSLVMSFLATLYPAYRASKVEPAEALRYDT